MDDKTIENLKEYGFIKDSFLPLIQIDGGILRVPQSLESEKNIGASHSFFLFLRKNSNSSKISIGHRPLIL